MVNTSEEVAKLQQHLSLLKEEYVKLQARCTLLEKKYAVASAAAGEVHEDTFVSKLLQTVADLFNQQLYSDIMVHLSQQDIYAHRFVLAARSSNWGIPSLANIDSLDWKDIADDIGVAILQWVYTDDVNFTKGDSFTLSLMKEAKRFCLEDLVSKCEKALMASVNVSNCIKYYTTAIDIGATTLIEYCSHLISTHWEDFASEDFENMTAPFLYKMLKEKTRHPLHAAIRLKREDVVFLFVVENNSEDETERTISSTCTGPSTSSIEQWFSNWVRVPPGYMNDLKGVRDQLRNIDNIHTTFLLQLHKKLNELDSKGDLPLDLALRSKQNGIAVTLVEHQVNLNAKDAQGWTLLHRAIQRGDKYSATFLIKNGASVSFVTPEEEDTALHLVAQFSTTSQDIISDMKDIGQQLLEKGLDPNIQNKDGYTAIHLSVIAKNTEILCLLLAHPKVNLDLKTKDGHTALWFAVQQCLKFDDTSHPSLLLKKGASPNPKYPKTGDTLLHLVAKEGLEEAGLFLCSQLADPNHSNNKGESPLHIAASKGLSRLVTTLLDSGANPNLQTLPPDELDYSSVIEVVYKQTPLHIAISEQQEEVARAILGYKDKAMASNKIIPNFNLKDSAGQTPLVLALSKRMQHLASDLIKGGADVNVQDAKGLTLLHRLTRENNAREAIFLLDHGADMNAITPDNETPLQLAIKCKLVELVDALCRRGVDMSIPDADNKCPLWIALESEQREISSILVRNGVDVDCWSDGPEGCYQTLLHRAIDENNEAIANFLIESGCDINSARRPSPSGKGGTEAYDQAGPVHLCCQWGLESVVQTLVEHGAAVNTRDAEGNTPLHIAIQNQHSRIIGMLLSHPGIDLTLRNKGGLTPFAAAMMYKNNKAAQAILNKLPTAAEQVDNKGCNYLHTAIKRRDIESVLFLLSIHVNIHSRVQDSAQMTPLHLAVEAASEIITRNLLLAGANVNDKNSHKQTALHIAAVVGNATISSVLLENKVDFDAVDHDLNNALHVAVREGHLSVVRVLLTESQINAESVNLKGQNPLHILANYGKENAAAIFDFFIECMPQYPVNKPDVEGNTALLLAYMKGNGNLCRALVKAGACLGSMNKQGVTIFNYQVATKQLLFSLLDCLSQEPPWAEGDICLECGVKFGITVRKHHCRHCGRILCNKCSDKDMPILKFSLNKPVRVCEVCFDVLQLGSSLA